MKRRGWLFCGAAAAALAAGFSWRQWHEPAGGGDELWAQRWPTPDGKELAMASLQGRPLLINFWATWCPPCVRELPMLDRFHRDRAGHGWQVLALAVDEAGRVQQFLQRTSVTLPIALGGAAGLAWSQRLGNAGGGLPFTVALDTRGKVRQRKIGELSEAELRSWVVFSTTPSK